MKSSYIPLFLASTSAALGPGQEAPALLLNLGSFPGDRSGSTPHSIDSGHPALVRAMQAPKKGEKPLITGRIEEVRRKAFLHNLAGVEKTHPVRNLARKLYVVCHKYKTTTPVLQHRDKVEYLSHKARVEVGRHFVK